MSGMKGYWQVEGDLSPEAATLGAESVMEAEAQGKSLVVVDGVTLRWVPPADSLDAAWAEAEAALPEGGYIWTEGPYDGSTDSDGNTTILGYSVHAFRMTEEPYRHAVELAKVVGPALAAALRALAEKLRGVGR